MEFQPSTDRQAREWLDLVFDPDICAVQEVEDMYQERDEIDRIVAEVDSELAAERQAARAELPRVDRSTRRQRHANRRAGREVLRALPVRPEATEDVVLGEAA